MRKWLQRLECHLEEYIAGMLLLIMAILVFLQVVMRYLFHSPFSWSDEIAIYCMVWSVYLSASWAVRERKHIRVMNFIHLFPKKIQLALITMSDLIWLACSLFIFWQAILLERSLWNLQYESPVLEIDQKWPYLIIALGFALMTFRQLQIYYHWFRHGISPLESKEHAVETLV